MIELYKVKREENEGERVVIAVEVIPEEKVEDDGEEVDIEFDVSVSAKKEFEIRKVPKKIEKRIKREERAIKRMTKNQDQEAVVTPHLELRKIPKKAKDRHSASWSQVYGEFTVTFIWRVSQLYGEFVCKLYARVNFFIGSDGVRWRGLSNKGLDVGVSCDAVLEDAMGFGRSKVTKDQFGDIDSCQMHDLVHDLLLSLSSHEISRLVVSDDVQIPAVKHLALEQIGYENSVFDKFKEDRTPRNLQTLFFAGGVKDNISLQYFKCLRILKLNLYSLNEVPESIGELVHLRYLDLSSTGIRTLPKSIGKLYHLQTLKLLGCPLIEFPQEMRNLISLRHLVYDHIDDYNAEVPKDVGLLTSLRTLPSFQVGRQIEELGHIKHLGGKLCIWNLEEIGSKEDALKPDLTGKPNLKMIEYHWSSCYEDADRNDKEVLEGLQSSPNVKILEIQNFSGDSFPEWAMKMKIKTERNWIPLSKLVKITLTDCRNCLNIPMLEDLPLLQDLVLRKLDKVTCLSSSSDQRKPLSPSLRSLELIVMNNLEKWTNAAVDSSTMLSPVLEQLTIMCCPKIIHLDESLQHPLVSLTIWEWDLHNQRCSLKDLTVKDCDKLTCLPGGFDCLVLLNDLYIGRFSKELHSFPSLSGIEKLGNHLNSLGLKGWEHWESLPEEIKHLNTLRDLWIEGFGVRELPMWLTNMSSIREIRFYDCMELDEESILKGVPREATRVVLNGKQIRG
ncbi:hypothetical protein CTI12_AA493290 [Artemisia annua]|uniref:Disease resistance R13L4/SHOC-2-like LRR domain-containing protein n=1 Tax=Artemisia annua TaxID=35608 RepID=A0A2U1LFW9_ARTAN|nr:hypothetical protein CTI12_AA493290 [Artemisia annua]